jgi:hypothetical protein
VSELKPDQVAAFWAFVQERQATWHRRFVLQEPKPWTADPVIAGGHFTNVYRWLDPGTQYAITSLQAMTDRADQVYFTVAYRLINRRATLEEFGRPPTVADHEEWLAFLTGKRERKETICITGKRHLTPHWRQYTEAITTAASPRFRLPETSETAYKALRSLPGIGRFMGQQCYGDLTYVPGLIRVNELFTSCGDGAAYAIELLRGSRSVEAYHHDRYDHSGRVRPSDREVPNYAAVIGWLFRTQPRIEAADPSWPPLSVIDLEHALCEWLRYEIAKAKQ